MTLTFSFPYLTSGCPGSVCFQKGGKEQQQQKCLFPIHFPSQPNPGEREAWGHREREDESWDMRAGRHFRGHLGQHQIARIRKMKFREFNVQAHKDYMRPMTRKAGPGTSKVLNKYWFHFLLQIIVCLILEFVVDTH